jgi:hypothetical protein
VAHAANFHFDQNFTRCEFGKRDILNREWNLEVAKHGSFHFLPWETITDPATQNRLEPPEEFRAAALAGKTPPH